MNNIKKFGDFTHTINEDGDAYVGANVGGVGAVSSAQPSSLPGSTIGADWSGNGGTMGSGDVSIPYNTGSSAIMQQNLSIGKSKEHGSVRGKKKKKNELDIKKLKSLMVNKDKTKTGNKKVMSFEDFYKADINLVKK